MPVERVARCVDGESGTATRSSAVRASPVPRSLLEGSRGSQTRKSRCLASDRGAAGRESGGWRRTRGRGSSLERPDDPGEISARNETPRRTFRGQGAAERGGAGALREGGRHGDALRWTCSDVSQKARRPPTEFRGSDLGEEGEVSARNERDSSDRTDASAAPGVVTSGRATTADTAEPGREREEDPVIF